MIIIDTETTGGTKPGVVAIEHQPEIIEFGAIEVDDASLSILHEFSFFIKPRILPLSADTEKYTGITTGMVENALPFARHVPELQRRFLGERTVVAHNCSYDMDVMFYELKRLGMERRFPWPPEQVDTVELTMDIPAARQKSARLKLGELHEALTGAKPLTAHRALDDCRTLLVCVRKLRELDGRI